jgi:hypothetical protein
MHAAGIAHNLSTGLSGSVVDGAASKPKMPKPQADQLDLAAARLNVGR